MAGMPMMHCVEWTALKQKENKEMSCLKEKREKEEDTRIQVLQAGILNQERKFVCGRMGLLSGAVGASEQSVCVWLFLLNQAEIKLPVIKL